MNKYKIKIYNVIVKFIPATKMFKLKSWLLRWAGANIGKNVKVVSSVKFITGGKLTIGDHTWIGHEVLFVGGDADIFIGQRVDIGPRVVFATGTHVIDFGSDRVAGPGYSKVINVGDGSWIGAGAIVLGGVSIGDMSIVGAAALVNKNVSGGVVVAGNPARVIKYGR